MKRLIFSILVFVGFFVSSCKVAEDYSSAREHMTQDFAQLPNIATSPNEGKDLNNEITILGDYIRNEQKALLSMGVVIQSLPHLSAEDKIKLQQYFTINDDGTLIYELAAIESHLVKARIFCTTMYVEECSKLPTLATQHGDQSVSLTISYQTILAAL